MQEIQDVEKQLPQTVQSRTEQSQQPRVERRELTLPRPSTTGQHNK